MTVPRRNATRCSCSRTAIGASASMSWPSTSIASMTPTTPRAGRARRQQDATGGRRGADWAARRCSAPITIGDRIAPIATEGARAYAYPRRRLTALVFGPLDHVEHARDHGAIETTLADLLDRKVLLDECLQDRVEHVIWRQRIGILLVRTQLG